MIKISNPNLKRISEDYFGKVKAYCLARAGLFRTLFNLYYGNGGLDEVSDFNIDVRIKKRCVNFLINNPKVGKKDSFNAIPGATLHTWVNTHHVILEQIIDYLNNEANLRELLLVSALESEGKDQYLQRHFGIATLRERNFIFEFINQILDYEMFGKIAYEIAEQLEQNTCVYCNRVYTNTVMSHKTQRGIRPAFDHFFSQKDHPFLALSFFNLIPSCYYCNSSLKSSAVTSH